MATADVHNPRRAKAVSIDLETESEQTEDEEEEDGVEDEETSYEYTPSIDASKFRMRKPPPGSKIAEMRDVIESQVSRSMRENDTYFHA